VRGVEKEGGARTNDGNAWRSESPDRLMRLTGYLLQRPLWKSGDSGPCQSGVLSGEGAHRPRGPGSGQTKRSSERGTHSFYITLPTLGSVLCATECPLERLPVINGEATPLRDMPPWT
jgi:hypothetical protein